MSLYTNLQDKIIEARKSNDEVAIPVYSALLGELARAGNSGTELSDDFVSAVAENTISSIDTALAASDPDENLERERELLVQFTVPKVDVEVVTSFASTFIASNPGSSIKNMGQIMSVIQCRFGTNFDVVAVGEFVKTQLTAWDTAAATVSSLVRDHSSPTITQS